MKSLAESMSAQAVMPRFEDGSINLRELIRTLAEDVVNAIMDAEADQLCAGGANSRNGYRERNLVTCVGDTTLRMPELRSGSSFPEDIVERCQRVDRARCSGSPRSSAFPNCRRTRSARWRRTSTPTRPSCSGGIWANRTRRICSSTPHTRSAAGAEGFAPPRR